MTCGIDTWNLMKSFLHFKQAEMLFIKQLQQQETRAQYMHQGTNSPDSSHLDFIRNSRYMELIFKPYTLMNITIAGTGYIGLVTGACLAEAGHSVTCIDIDQKRIAELRQGIIPIHEPGLDELVIRNATENRLAFDTDLKRHVNQSDALFIAVGTPPLASGKTDLSYVEAVAKSIGKYMEHPCLIVIKSTVPVGTSGNIGKILTRELKLRNAGCRFELASNPEFLREGQAVADFMHPDRIIAGTSSLHAKELMETIYKPFTIHGVKLIHMDIPSAEMTKYAANTMLATRISFMNEIANLCDAVGADIRMVRHGMASDERIGCHFLNPGCGYGGSCFPKDVQSLIQTGLQHGLEMKIAQATEQVNATQRSILVDKLIHLWEGIPGLMNKTVAIWGAAFKPDTDDTREAPSAAMIHRLLDLGVTVRLYDPVVRNITRFFPDRNAVYEANSINDAVLGADALLVVTEWDDFREPDWKRIRELMHGDIVLDGRNMYSPRLLRQEGFLYQGIGIPA